MYAERGAEGCDVWQLDWASEPVGGPVRAEPSGPLRPGQRDVASIGGLMWEEHCHECAVPDCYRTCPLYARRGDGGCARFEYGIFPDRAFSGPSGFGADVRFRRWAKLESPIPVGRLPVRLAPILSRIDRRLAGVARRVDAARGHPAQRRMTSAYSLARLEALRFAPTVRFDEFVIEVWSPETDDVRLAVECKDEGASYFRDSLTIRPGWNHITMPAEPLLVGATGRGSRILVYPEADAQVRLVFTWLDLVRYRARPATRRVDRPGPATADGGRPTVKCVVWDLDNTLWRGILADDGAEALELTREIRDTVEQLDQRGILQSIASKNDHDEAWAVVVQLGLDQMFLHPSIHWGPKGDSVRRIATALNIGLDTVAFVDDAAVERAQVRDACPEVRAYDVTEVPGLLDLPDFAVLPSAEGRRRRLSYLAEIERERASESTPSGSLDDFLRSCQLEVAITVPSNEAAIDRSHELLLRSNQLNLSTRRYSRADLEALLADERRLAVSVAVRDRYGDYGSVGFLSMSLEHGAVQVDDLVLSCRVAKKAIEHAVLEAVRRQVHGRASAIRMDFRPSARNGPLREALTDTGASIDGSDADVVRFELDPEQPVNRSDLVEHVDIDTAVVARLDRLLAGGGHAVEHERAVAVSGRRSTSR